MSSGTGERGDYVVVDDPHSVDQAESDAERQSALEWWNGSMSTRLNDFGKGHKIVIQQRLHEADLTGDLLERGGYELLCLPAEFEPDRRCSTSIGWIDSRRDMGELLWPDTVTQADLESLKTTLGAYRYAGQYQQRPAPAGGGMLKPHWWKYWQPRGANLGPVSVKMPDGTTEQRMPVDLPAKFDIVLQSWDMSFKDTQRADFVAGLVLAASGADRFILDTEHARMDLPETLMAVRRLSARWPNAQMKLVEDKANGPAVIQSLRHEIGGFIEVTPEGGKASRAAAAAPMLEAGNWYLPDPRLFDWVTAFLHELGTFPAGAFDDWVDAWSQGAKRVIYVKPKSTPPRIYRPWVSSDPRAWMA
jgi:predicted phage terminase large subunit-like protein